MVRVEYSADSSRRSRPASTFDTFTRAIVAVAVVCSAAGLAACEQGSLGNKGKGDNLTAVAEFKVSRQQLARASKRLFQDAKPFTNQAALAARLKLDPARVRGFTQTGSVSSVTAFDSGTNCKMGHCTCVGDRDCNDMFSTICRSPSTGGSCDVSESEVVCTCKYVDAD